MGGHSVKLYGTVFFFCCIYFNVVCSFLSTRLLGGGPWGAVPGGRSLGKCEATLPPAAHTPSAVAGLVTAHGRSVAEHNHGFKKLGDKAWRRRAVLTTGRNGITGGDRSE